MKVRFPFAFALAIAGVAVGHSQVTDPRITSWVTSRSAQYARVYETASDKTSGNAVSTWPRAGLTNGGGGQATSAYSDIQRVAYSSNYVYIYTSGLPSYVMGNWLTPNGQTYTSWPTNRAAIHRIPRNPTIPTTKQANHGSGGVLVNGVFVWENGDAQSYSTSTGTVSMGGDGIWNRLAGVAEAFNFDTANAHQPSSGAYHNHINPIALRYQLGDNVTYNASTKAYSEAGTPTKHSPIIGWANDGLPIYGPYGYSSALDPTSGIRRMTSGFTKRNGSNGSTNLATTGRTTLPVWAASVQNRSQTLSASQYGPSTTTTYNVGGGVTATYSIGTFAEDYEYLGDLGKTQGVDFDLNRQNVRFCVTPEFPNGTYAYFVCIDSAGATAFPDIINQEYFGSAPNGQGTVTSITEAVTEYQDVGPASAITVNATASGNGVALAWNSAEGATYKVESSADSSAWATLSSAVTSGGLTTNYSATATANYFRVTLTAIATYDTGGTYGTPVGKSATIQFGSSVVAPAITTQPSNASVTAGASVTFTVAASGSSPLTYQWQKGGATIAGATSATYTISTTTMNDAGTYTCVVTNSAGSATSNAATLTVSAAATAPAITVQPSNVSVLAGSSASFSIVATGTAPLTYQWSKGGTAISGATSATYSIASAQASDAGTYMCTVTNSAGAVTSSGATLALTTVTVAPSITQQPVNVTVNEGASATFSVVVSGTAPFTFQWLKGSTAITGATTGNYTIAATTTADAASYKCTISNSAGTVTTNSATLTVNSTSSGGTSGGGSTGGGTSGGGTTGGGTTTPAAQIVNLAVRTQIGGAAGTPITGFVLTGSGAGKRLVIRAVGPTLTQYGVSGVFADPKLQLWSGGVMLAENDNWKATDSTNFTSVGAFPLTIGSADAAIVTTLTAGAYSTPVSGPAGTTGVVLIECYDASTSDTSTQLVNASARALVGTGDNVLIPGFVITGTGTVDLLIRAVGPELVNYGVSDFLVDPQVTIYTGSTVVASNDNWTDGGHAAPIVAAASKVGAFPLTAGSKDAALVVSLPAGAYSAVVSGVGDTTGTALVELYVVPK
jgi:hypothetical protein